MTLGVKPVGSNMVLTPLEDLRGAPTRPSPLPPILRPMRRLAVFFGLVWKAFLAESPILEKWLAKAGINKIWQHTVVRPRKASL